MSWLQSTLSRAAQHPSVTSALEQARWHRKESEDFLRHSVQAMYQHERDAVHLASTAQRLQHELLMQEGMAAGVWQEYGRRMRSSTAPRVEPASRCTPVGCG